MYYGIWADCVLLGSNPEQKYKKMCLHPLFIPLSHSTFFHSTPILWGCFLFSAASNHSKCFPLPDSTVPAYISFIKSLFSFRISQVNVLKS